MSTQTAPRGQRGGSASRAGRATQFQATRGRAGSRGLTTPARARGRGRGGVAQNGAGDAHANNPAAGPAGLLQKLRQGTAQRSPADVTTPATRGREAPMAFANSNLAITAKSIPGRAAPTSRGPSTPNTRARGRGRGRGNLTQVFHDPKPQSSPAPSRTSSPAPTNYRDLMNAAESSFKTLQKRREEERAQAIRDGFLSDPEKKTSLANAITPVGTCTDLCPRFERVERIHQQMVDQAEKFYDEESARYLPSEDRMVKRFRRSAAGYDEQLPSDIRTPDTLRRTLDYLLDKLIGGGQRLATVHKFVWDRTRGIRNDFSIQQVSKPEHVKLAVECYERIARFHILSLHQLSNPENLYEDENFDAHQDREQLNNTLLSLLYYYDDHRDRIHFPNEAEFRAYCIIFELQSQNPDILDRVQQWPDDLLHDQRVKVALQLYNAAGNTLFVQGPLQPMDTFAVAQNNNGSFWSVLSSDRVPYILACVAEIYFGAIRFAALDALWRSVKSAPLAQQARSRDWSLSEITTYLGFDHEDETREFCAAFSLDFVPDDHGEEFLDPTALSDPELDQSSIPRRQAFSHSHVEKKRFRRSLTAVINGVSVAKAIRDGLIESDESKPDAGDSQDDENSLFIPETRPFGGPTSTSTFGTALNPTATTFTPTSSISSIFGQPASFKPFGSSVTPNMSTTPDYQNTPFGQPSTSQRTFAPFGTSTDAAIATGAVKSASDAPVVATPSFAPFGQPTVTPKTSTFSGFGLPTSTQASSSSFSFGRPAPAPAPVAAASAQQPLPSTSSFVSSGSIPEPWDSDTKSKSAADSFNWGQPAKTTALPASASSPNVQLPSSPTSLAPTTSLSDPFSNTTTTSFQPPAGPRFDFANPSVQQPPTQQTSVSSPLSGFSSQPQSITFSQPPPLADLKQSTASAPSDLQPPSPDPATTTSSTTDVSPRPPSTTAGQSAPPFTFPSSLPGPSQSAQTSKTDPLGRKRLHETPNTPRVPSPLSRSTTPPHSPPRTRADQPQKPKQDDRLVSDLARVALVRPGGLVGQFIEWTLPELLESVIEQYHREVLRTRIVSIRRRIIMRKFANLWRSLTWNNLLKRKANNRRQKFAEAVKAKEDKKRNAEAELDAIKAAVEETRRLQKIQRDREEDERAVREIIRARKAQQDAGSRTIKVAGQKRKSLSENDETGGADHDEILGTSTPGHKRSRTISTLSDPSSAMRTQRSLNGQIHSNPVFVASPSKPERSSLHSSGLGRSMSSEQLRQSKVGSFNSSQRGKKLDTTKTDYFRLKALGLDPETPLVPLTERQLEMKTKREAEEKQAVLDRIMRRRHTGRAITKAPSPPASTNAEALMNTIEVDHDRASEPPPILFDQSSKITPSAGLDREIDELIQQSRKQREALAKDTDWLKESREELEQQFTQTVHVTNIHQESKLNPSPRMHNTVPSPNSKGLARVNGFDYLPAKNDFGQSLSRTEQRIRATGAHGLANKPLRPHRDYVTVGVAMSKRSASSIYRPELSSQQLSSPSRKRLLDNIDSIPHTGESTRTTKRSRLTPEKEILKTERINSHYVSIKKNPYDVLGSAEDSEYEDDDGRVQDLRDVRPNGQQVEYYAEDDYGDEEDEEEDLEEDLEEEDMDELDEGEEDEEEEEEEEDDDDGGRKISYGQEAYIMDEDELEEEREEDDDDDDDDAFDEDSPAYIQGDAGFGVRVGRHHGHLSPEDFAQGSRSASSGPGATEDDALVLSDSD